MFYKESTKLFNQKSQFSRSVYTPQHFYSNPVENNLTSFSDSSKKCKVAMVRDYTIFFQMSDSYYQYEKAYDISLVKKIISMNNWNNNN